MEMEFSKERIVEGVVGPWSDYCDGYGNSLSSGNSYVSVLSLSTAVIDTSIDLSPQLRAIVAFDMAEAGTQSNSAYIGQINLLHASSFCGLNGLVWGLDVARSPSVEAQKPVHTLHVEGKDIPVYDAEPLLDAAKELFGTVNDKKFPIAPGAHVICASKHCVTPQPCEQDLLVYCAIGMAIPEDPKEARCFMEDVGYTEDTSDPEAFRKLELQRVANSYIYIGQAQKVKYKEIYVGVKVAKVPKGSSGCALVCAPYVVLAKNAVPKDPKELLRMSLPEWKESCFTQEG